eukprot:TRINITY_DN51584_c0_g1_i1.p1 TRINITY_DN51584_c0_g1~~TRINITY_DN51584_c0_g1_i1.p1  ORF type:complete len:978 (+),score=242.33 TRINITY_DN51584_c0_g1_i1:104-3037(+)
MKYEEETDIDSDEEDRLGLLKNKIDGLRPRTSRYYGVTHMPQRGKWQARKHNKGEVRYLGFYPSELTAALAVRAFVLRAEGNEEAAHKIDEIRINREAKLHSRMMGSLVSGSSGGISSGGGSSSSSAPVPADITAAPADFEGTQRRLNITADLILKHGETPGCRGCLHRIKGACPLSHIAQCRGRFEELVFGKRASPQAEVAAPTAVQAAPPDETEKEQDEEDDEPAMGDFAFEDSFDPFAPEAMEVSADAKGSQVQLQVLATSDRAAPPAAALSLQAPVSMPVAQGLQLAQPWRPKIWSSQLSITTEMVEKHGATAGCGGCVNRLARGPPRRHLLECRQRFEQMYKDHRILGGLDDQAEDGDGDAQGPTDEELFEASIVNGALMLSSKLIERYGATEDCKGCFNKWGKKAAEVHLPECCRRFEAYALAAGFEVAMANLSPHLRVTKEHCEKYGKTLGCGGCQDRLQDGQYSKHTRKCRQRFFKLLGGIVIPGYKKRKPREEEVTNSTDQTRPDGSSAAQAVPVKGHFLHKMQKKIKKQKARQASAGTFLSAAALPRDAIAATLARTTICYKCGKNTGAGKFCAQCGCARLCLHCGTIKQTASKLCLRCGAINQEPSAAATGGDDAADKKSKKRKNKRRSTSSSSTSSTSSSEPAAKAKKPTPAPGVAPRAPGATAPAASVAAAKAGTTLVGASSAAVAAAAAKVAALKAAAAKAAAAKSATAGRPVAAAGDMAAKMQNPAFAASQAAQAAGIDFFSLPAEAQAAWMFGYMSLAGGKRASAAGAAGSLPVPTPQGSAVQGQGHPARPPAAQEHASSAPRSAQQPRSAGHAAQHARSGSSEVRGGPPASKQAPPAAVPPPPSRSLSPDEEEAVMCAIEPGAFLTCRVSEEEERARQHELEQMRRWEAAGGDELERRLQESWEAARRRRIQEKQAQASKTQAVKNGKAAPSSAGSCALASTTAKRTSPSISPSVEEAKQ